MLVLCVEVVFCILVQVRDRLVAATKELKLGPGEDFTSFLSAVIDEKVCVQLMRALWGAKWDKKPCTI